MSKRHTKASGNVFYEARTAAASWNDTLNSREGAAEETGLDRTRIAYIELGTINPHPEEVLILADTYNAPELLNYFCSHLCPLGRRTVRHVELQELEKSTLQFLSSLNHIPDIKESLITIAADGVIDESEKPKMEDILTRLDDAAAKIDALKLFYQKQFGNRTK